MKRFYIFCILGGCALFLNSCATAPVSPPPQAAAPVATTIPIIRSDMVHIVAPGETIWRISKMYDVPMDEIMRVNSISVPEELEKGQRLRIPNAAPLAPVITLYPSGKWKYIIIHHSATDEGNSLYFDKAHCLRGWEGVGYHFVIDNGTKEKQDGQIETTPRWLHQKTGSHCKAAGMNAKGIGICLVGNFSEENVSEAQINSLVFLVSRLKQYYKIPDNRILGHGQVSGARTECPGTKFPWVEFRRRLSVSQ